MTVDEQAEFDLLRKERDVLIADVARTDRALEASRELLDAVCFDCEAVPEAMTLRRAIYDVDVARLRPV